MVVNHAVRHQGGAVIFVMNGLLALRGIHDSQTGMAQHAMVKLMHAVTIRPAVLLRLHHFFQLCFVNLAPNTCNSTHNRLLHQFVCFRPFKWPLSYRYGDKLTNFNPLYRALPCVATINS